MSTTENTVKTICFECHTRCGVILNVKDGRIESIKGDKSHPISEGVMCPKGRAVKEIVYHPDRLLYPQKRIGSKGEKKWERITWDEALDTIAAKLAQIRENHGPEAIVAGQGTSRGLGPYLSTFQRYLGSPSKMSPMHISGAPIAIATSLTAGFHLIMSEDLKNTQCIVLWGHNPPQSWPGRTPHLFQALKRGAKLIVIDPRRSEMAAKADIWLQIRPGADCALALAMLNVIIEEGLYDKDFVEKWTYGFDRLRKHVKAYSPEKMEEVTWVPADLIRKATRLYVQEKPSSVCFGTAALCQHPNSIQTNRAIASIVGLTGNLEIPGGNVNFISPLGTRSYPSMELNPLPPEVAEKSLCKGRLRLFELNKTMFAHPRAVWEAVLCGKPYSVKAILLFASNPLLAYANTSLAKEALDKIDFLVSADYFMNPTAELADIVLPAAHWAERDDIDDLGGGFVFAQPKAVEPLGECWDEKKILVELAKRLGLKDYWKSVGEIMDYRLAEVGITFEQLKQVGQIERKVEYKGYEKSGKFNTPSGKVELYSDSFEQIGLDPMPVHAEPPESPISTPELAKDYPLVMTTGARHIAYYHSALRNIPSLRKLDPEPTVDINPTTAESLGIKDGDWVLIETPRGGIKRKARFFDGIHPKVVHMTHGWWYGYEPEWKSVNVNILTDNSDLDNIIGSEPLKCLLCRVRSVPKDRKAA